MDNIVAQSSLLNRSGGDWYAMEKEWADVLDNGGTITDLKINLSYSGTSGRPTSFDVSYKINNGEPIELTFYN